MNKIKSLVLILSLFLNPSFCFPQSGFVVSLPKPGEKVFASIPFIPVLVKGLVVHPDKPLNFEFIVDSGNGPADQISIKEQTQLMAQYFLAAITIPEDQLWVNLSPYEKDHIIENGLGQTVLGRDMLAQDYILKQLAASILYPEQRLGKEFWAKVYQETQKKFGTTVLPVDTFNKVWIMPEKAEVFEKGNAVYVTEAKLKVMLDQDYLATIHNLRKSETQRNNITQNVIHQIILPELEKEVNKGKNFAPMRQIYQMAILAKWYRQLAQDTLLAHTYVGKNKVAGILSKEKQLKEEIYQRYIAAYKKGVFNYIKDENNVVTGKAQARKYFSGGISDLAMKNIQLDRTDNPSTLVSMGKIYRVDMAMGDPGSEGNNSNRQALTREYPVAFAITGATGSVGTQLLRQLLASRSTKAVYVLVRKKDENERANETLKQKLLLSDSRVHVIYGDLLEKEKLEQMVNNSDVVYHLAAWAGIGKKTVREALEDNVVPTVMLSRLAESKGKRLVLASTVHFYNLGSQREGVVSEDKLSLTPEQLGKVGQMLAYADARANNLMKISSVETASLLDIDDKELYAFTKLAAEKAVLRAPKGLALRMANVYGPGDDTERQVPKFIKSMAAGAAKVTYIPGRVNSFIYVNDLVRAFTAAGRVAVGQNDRIINVSSPGQVPQEELFESIKQVVGSQAKVEGMSLEDVARLKLASPPPVIFDTRRMAEVLGIQTTKKLVDGLKETKEWLQSSREQQWAPYPEESDGLMKSADAAMKGGIDIRDIGVYHDKGVKKIRFDEASLQSMRTEGFRGFAPVILSIQPIQDLQVAMGLPGQ